MAPVIDGALDEELSRMVTITALAVSGTESVWPSAKSGKLMKEG
jgi:hypothetical protein